MPLDRASLRTPPLRGQVLSSLAGVCAALKAEEASFWCVSADGARMDVAVNHGPQAALLESLSVPVCDSVVGLVQATRMATAIGPDDAHHLGVDQATGVRTHAMVAAPVSGPAGVLGVLSVINPLSAPRFSGADLQHLTQAADALGRSLLEAADRGP